MIKIGRKLRSLVSFFLFIIVWFYGYYIFRIRNKVKIIGQKNLPKSVNTLFLANHQTLMDSFLIGVSVISLKELIFNPIRLPWNAPDKDNFFHNKIMKNIMGLLKTIPVIRNSKRKKNTDNNIIKKQIKRFCSALRHSNLLLFFEGTRSRTKKIGKCKFGVTEAVRIAKPKYVVPILLHNIHDIMPIKVGFNWFKIGRNKEGFIVIGKPVDFSDLYCLSKDQEVRMLISERIRKSVVDLKKDLP